MIDLGGDVTGNGISKLGVHYLEEVLQCLSHKMLAGRAGLLGPLYLDIASVTPPQDIGCGDGDKIWRDTSRCYISVARRR